MNTLSASGEENEQEFEDVDVSALDDLFGDADFLSEFPDYSYEPMTEPFVPTSPISLATSMNEQKDPQLTDNGWVWHDAALVGVERANETGVTSYEVGCVDLYTNTQSGDLGGNYLKMGSFEDVDAAATFYQDIQRQIHDQRILPFHIAEFASRNTLERPEVSGLEAPNWIACSPAEYAAYEEIRLPGGNSGDSPSAPSLQDLLDQVAEFNGPVSGLPETSEVGEQGSTFQALNNIGIKAEGFDPDKDPAPFFDESSNTAYWIGVFQPDRQDSSNCVASILSLARDPKTGEVEALLAPCVPGDWDKAYQACEHLLDAVEKGGIERCFDTAEGMALAADQRELWEKEHGLSLESDAANELADYTQSTWEIEL